MVRELSGRSPDELQITIAELEGTVKEQKSRIIELTQGFRDLARDEIDRRLAHLYGGLLGEVSLLNYHKKTTLNDANNVLISFEVAAPLRELLFEENPEHTIEVEITPPHPRFAMIMRNPKTGAWVMIGAVRPYACPFVPSGGKLSSVTEKAVEYREKMKGDDHVIKDYSIAKKLIGAVAQIALFDNHFQP